MLQEELWGSKEPEVFKSVMGHRIRKPDMGSSVDNLLYKMMGLLLINNVKYSTHTEEENHCHITFKLIKSILVLCITSH